MEIHIYHRTDRSRFFEIADAVKFGDVPALELAYSYNDDNFDLNHIFRVNNRVDGSPKEVVPDGKRSLSVGDVVLLGEVPCEVLGAGWADVDTATFAAAVEAGKAVTA